MIAPGRTGLIRLRTAHKNVRYRLTGLERYPYGIRHQAASSLRQTASRSGVVASPSRGIARHRIGNPAEAALVGRLDWQRPLSEGSSEAAYVDGPPGATELCILLSLLSSILADDGRARPFALPSFQQPADAVTFSTTSASQ